MVQLRLTEEQARLLRQGANQPVQLCGPAGEVLGWVEPQLTKEYVEQLKAKARSAGPWYSGEQVQRRLQALQAERDRIGDFDETHLRELLERLNKDDPGQHATGAAGMMQDIVEAVPLEGHRLRLVFEDGASGVVDLASLVSFTGVFEPLLDRAEFFAARVDPELGTVVWPCGADLDPDVLYALVTGKPAPSLENLGAAK